MWEMTKSSISLFLQGKLFADPAQVYKQMAIGVIVTAVLLYALTYVGLHPILASIIAGLLGGALQPYLFKNLKYR